MRTILYKPTDARSIIAAAMEYYIHGGQLTETAIDYDGRPLGAVWHDLTNHPHHPVVVQALDYDNDTELAAGIVKRFGCIDCDPDALEELVSLFYRKNLNEQNYGLLKELKAEGATVGQETPIIELEAEEEVEVPIEEEPPVVKALVKKKAKPKAKKAAPKKKVATTKSVPKKKVVKKKPVAKKRKR